MTDEEIKAELHAKNQLRYNEGGLEYVPVEKRHYIYLRLDDAVAVCRSVASRARGEALEEAKAAVCWCEAGKRSGYHIAECPAARLRELERFAAGVGGGEGRK